MFGILSLGDPSIGTLAVDTICIFKVRALEMGNGELYNVGSEGCKVLYSILLYKS